MLIDLTKSPVRPSGKAVGAPRANVRKLTIKNYSPKGSAERQAEYYENTFRKLNDALDIILAGRELHGLQDLYKGCENVVRGGKAGRCATMANEKMTAHIKRHRSSLAQRINGGESAVHLVVESWRAWNKQLSMVRSILFYLDRTYLLSDATQLSLADTGATLYRQEMILQADIGDHFMSGLMSTFDECRAGDDSRRLHTTILTDAMQMLSCVKLYETFFEPYFLKSSQKFYELESDRSFTMPIEEKLDFITSRLETEEEIAEIYLRSTTKTATISIVKEQMIKLCADDIVVGFDDLLDNRDAVRLARMYDQLLMVAESAKLRVAFASYIKKAGMQILSDKANDKTMVESLLTFKEEMDKILVHAFNSEDLFSKALRDQFSSFINSRGDVPAEMMAKFIDAVLRSGNKKFDEDDLERQMSRLMDIFRFIASKDVFEAFYKKDLAKRLLLNKSASADAERSLLAKLKIECGAGFTHKLEGMFKDIDISRDYGKNFPNKSLDVAVLSQGSWPTYPELKAQLPEEMSKALQEYQEYYLKSNNGRKLMWRHSLGHCQIKASFPKGDKELLVSLFQGIVLLLFNNDADALTYGEIKANTGLEGTVLVRTLQSLACGKPETRVLLKSPKGKDVNETDIFKVNENFQHAKKIVKINQIQFKETAEENKATHDRVIQDRSFEIQAAIIRIMKSAKKKSHAELIAATIDTIKGRGLPQVTDIKKAIEKLLDREYLSRHDKDYHYEA